MFLVLTNIIKFNSQFFNRSSAQARFCSDPGRTSTVVYNRIRRNATVYMWSYTETYGDIWRKKQSFTVLVHGGRIQSPFSFLYDRNTIICITAKYGRIVNVYGCLRPYTVVYDRIRLFTTVYGARNSWLGEEWIGVAVRKHRILDWKYGLLDIIPFCFVSCELCMTEASK
jgi:hypothetical protein